MIWLQFTCFFLVANISSFNNSTNLSLEQYFQIIKASAQPTNTVCGMNLFYENRFYQTYLSISLNNRMLIRTIFIRLN